MTAHELVSSWSAEDARTLGLQLLAEFLGVAFGRRRRPNVVNNIISERRRRENINRATPGGIWGRGSMLGAAVICAQSGV